MRSYRACHRRGYRNRIALVATSVTVGLVEAAIGVAFKPSLLWPGVALALYGAGFFLLRERAVRKQLAPYLKTTREVTITLTDAEYRTQGPDRSTARTWTTFSNVSRVDDFWVLRVSPQMAMGLPTSALDDQQTAAFVSLINEKGLNRA
jgi:hypothetical protein